MRLIYAVAFTVLWNTTQTNEAVVVGEHGERSLKHLTQAKSYFISNLNVFCF